MITLPWILIHYIKLLKLAFCLLGGSQINDCTERKFAKNARFSPGYPLLHTSENLTCFRRRICHVEEHLQSVPFWHHTLKSNKKCDKLLTTIANRQSKIKCKTHTLLYIIRVKYNLLSCDYVLPKL